MNFGLHEVWIYRGEWPDVCFGRCAFGAEGGHHKLTGGLLWCPTFFGLEKPSVFNDCRKWHKWHRKQKTKVCNLDFSMTADDCHSNYRWCFMSAAPAGEVQKSCQVSIFKTVIYWPGQPCLEVSGGIWDEQLEDEQSLILFRQSLPSKQPVQVGERSAFSEMETHLKNVDVQPHNC